MELLVVITIGSILLLIGVGRYRVHQAERDLDGAYRQVATLLNYARSTATAQGGTTVTFTTGPGMTLAITSSGGQVLKFFQAAGTVKVATPNSQLVFPYAAGGNISGSTASLVFTFSSTGTNTTRTLTLNGLTGGVVEL